MSEPQNPSVFSFEAQTGQEAVLEIAQRNMPATASDSQLRLAMEGLDSPMIPEGVWRDYLPQRVDMMRWWAAQVDSWRNTPK